MHAQAASRLTGFERDRILMAASALMRERRDLFVDTVVADTGFTLTDAERETDRATETLLNNFLNGVTLAVTAEVMVAGRKAGLDLVQLLEVLNSSTGVSFATRNRFPHIVPGDYLEGGLTGRLMTKDIALYVDLVGRLGVPSLNASGPLASFGLAENLGYGDQISNRVVDAIGDVAGGVRVHDTTEG